MVSTFAFLLALGIVVDDAIVIGENVYRHREMGKSPVRAGARRHDRGRRGRCWRR